MVAPDFVNSNNIIISNENNNKNNYKNKNNKLTPQSYLKNLYEDVPVRAKNKKIKVTEETFMIPEYGEHDMLLKYNYNVKQLKNICKYYKLQVSGNKQILIHRIYNFLKFSSAAVEIQKLFRGVIIRYLFKLKGGKFIFPINRKQCVNPSDFITLDDVEDIPFGQFITVSDATNKHVYGFDICSLYNYLMKNKTESKNPYNRELFKPNLILYIRRVYKITKLVKIDCCIKVDNSDITTLSSEEQFHLRVLSVFQKMDELGNYTDSTWFLNLNLTEIAKFLRELYDIWFHRANLSPSVQYNIYPLGGDPFRNLQNVGTSFTSYINRNHTNNEIQFKDNALKIIERLVTSGLTNDLKYLGTSYVLAALTLVSNSAAQAMPWLYQSVV